MNFQDLITTFEQQKKSFTKLNQLAEKLSGSQKTLQSLKSTETKKITEIDVKLENFVAVVQLLQMVAEQAQGQVTKVEKICSEALRDILGDPDLAFVFKMEKKRNAIETKFYIHDTKIGDIDLMHGEAGGTKNVIAVGLRLVFNELYSPKIDGPIILDEAGGNISREYQESFGKFLKKFSSLTGRQIILVSHHAPVIQEASRKIVVGKQGSESLVTIQ